MRLLEKNGRLTLLLGIVFLMAVPVASQSSRCKAKTADFGQRCVDHILVEYLPVTTSRFWGTVESHLDKPILIEVFSISAADRKKPSYDLANVDQRVLAFAPDSNGRFCHPGLKDGYYVIRYGSDGSKCTYQKVRIRRG